MNELDAEQAAVEWGVSPLVAAVRTACRYSVTGWPFTVGKAFDEYIFEETLPAENTSSSVPCRQVASASETDGGNSSTAAQ